MESQQNSKKDKLIKYIGILSVAIIFYIGYSELKSYHGTRELEEMNAALKDSLQTWVNRDGHNQSRISTLTSRNAELFEKVETRDSTIAWLQEEVAKRRKDGGLKEPGSSVSVVGTETDVDVTSPTDIIYDIPILEGDNDSIPDKMPTYRSQFNLDGWLFGSVVAKSDSTRVTAKVKDEFVISLDYEKQGFMGLGKPKPYADIVSKNPYSKVKEFRTYQVDTPKPYNLIIGPSIGYGFGGMTPGPIIGFSAVYPLIKLRL